MNYKIQRNLIFLNVNYRSNKLILFFFITFTLFGFLFCQNTPISSNSEVNYLKDNDTIGSKFTNLINSSIPEGLLKIQNAFPDFKFQVDSNTLIWPDGERMKFDDHIVNKEFNILLDNPCLKNQLEMSYPKGKVYKTPTVNHDPGRIRYEPFFKKMYGSNPQEVKKNLKKIDWMPKTGKIKLWINSVNGVHEKLKAISAELDELPESLKRYVARPGGAYMWRNIYKTKHLSSHSYGIALDINVEHSNYWLWDSSITKGKFSYRNQIPVKIVEIFEKHGFIWGGKWYHYDTMHFEYRPELLNN